MESIPNFVALTDRIGTAGQPAPDQFALIADAGYQYVINLAMPDHPKAVALEGDLVTRAGMGYIHLPVPFANPAPADVRRFCRMLQPLLEDDPSCRVFIHCIMNYRVSAFMYHYLSKIENRDDASARSPLLDRWEPDPVWSALLSWRREDLGL